MNMLSGLVPLIVFAVSTGFTPGPNNVLVAASGANFGYGRSLAHILGITVGFPVLILAVGLGLAQFFTAYPLLHQLLKAGGVLYLFYMAWKVATAAGRPQAPGTGKPFTFLQAVGFQWINPKGVVMGVTAVSTFTAVNGNMIVEVGRIALVFMVVGYLSSSSWCLFGAAISRVLKTPAALRRFNYTMAALLALSVLLILV
jgi:threonine/homoserine/homoserine lactone efflux protein